VGDSLTERASLRPLDVDVDPLVVIGCIGEAVDLLLGNLAPLAVAEVRACPRLQLVDALQQCHGHGFPISVSIRRFEFRRSSS